MTATLQAPKKVGARAPAAWRLVPLSEVVDILDSKRVPVNSSERAKRSGIVPYYGATGQVGYIDRHLFDEELILLGEDGAPFLDPRKPKAYLIRGKSWVNNHAHVLRGKSGLLNSFLLYQLNNLDYRPYVSGTTRLKLPQGPMKQIPLLIPPLDEQRAIVAEIEKQFTRLEAGVGALKRVQANLKRYRAAVLKAACEGKLVPTEAELAKQKAETGKLKPEYETGEQLLQRILTERRKNWTGRGKYKEPTAPDTSKLPNLPEGWVWASVEQLAAETMIGLDRGRSQQSDDSANGVPYIKMNNVTMEGRVHCEELVFVPVSREEAARYAVQDGDILFNTRNSKELVGKVGLARTPPSGAIYNNNLMRIRVPSDVSHAFVALQMCAHEFRQRMELVKKATTSVAAVYSKDLLPLALAFPPKEEQKRIVEEVERRLSVIDEMEATVSANLQRATRLRQSILQKVFSPEA